MPVTTISSGSDLAVKKWSDLAFREYVDKLVLKPYMDVSPEAVIHIREDLTKEQGDALTFSLAQALDGAGVTGESSMEGAEESQTFYGHRVTMEQYKNAILIGGSMTKRRAPWDIKMEATAALTTWMAQQIEGRAFNRLAAINGTTYGSAAEGDKDSYLASNADRFLFGAAVANNASNDHSSALSQIDGTTDVLTVGQISLAKRLAQMANPKIRPIRIENGEEYYVMFVHPLCARDLKNSDAWQNAQRSGMARGMDNPIFTGMLGMWDGVILKESNKCLLLPDVGDSSSVDVAANFLCGAQALLFAQGGYDGDQRVVMTEKLFDYDEKPGIQIKSTYGMEKAIFNSKQHGVVTVYSSAQPD